MTAARLYEPRSFFVRPDQIERLESLRRPGESRSAAFRRLLDALLYEPGDEVTVRRIERVRTVAPTRYEHAVSKLRG